MKDTISPLALRPREAARMLSISVRTLWGLTKAGIIPSVIVGGNERRIHLYPVAMLQTWLANQATTLSEDNR